VLADMCIPGYWAAGYWRAPGPRSFAYPLGWGTLGFALPAAVGAAASGRRALVITGDAGALYAIGELATAVQERLPIAVLVVNDDGYGMLRFDERARFGRAIASDLRTPDFVALGESFGVPSKRVSMRDTPAGVRWAMEQDGPALLELPARLEPPLTTSPRWPLKGKPEARP
jgi:acetolactate synthase-1/2/3 large subunit